MNICTHAVSSPGEFAASYREIPSMPAVQQTAPRNRSQQPLSEVNRTGPWHIGEVLPQVLAAVLSRPQQAPWGAAWEGDAATEVSAYATL